MENAHKNSKHTSDKLVATICKYNCLTNAIDLPNSYKAIVNMNNLSMFPPLHIPDYSHDHSQGSPTSKHADNN